MKKITSIFIFCSLLCFFSCATNSNSNDITTKNNEDIIEAPEKSDNTLESNETDDDVIFLSEDENSLVSEAYPELEDIEEPDITTLEWTEPELAENENADSDNLNTEPVITELPTTEDFPQFDVVISDDENDENDENNEVDQIIAIDEADEIDPDKNDLEIEKENVEINIVETTEEDEIVPSRKVTLKKFEYLEITYPGNGWVFMGLTDGSKDLSFFGRKLGTENTKFTLQAKVPGTKLLHFYKNDPVKNQYIDDYIEVEILNEKGLTSSHINAPPYKTSVPPKAKKIIEQKKAEVESQTTEISQEESDVVEVSDSTSNKSKETNQKKAGKNGNSKSVIKTENQKKVDNSQDKNKTSVQEPITEEFLNKENIDSNSLLQEAQVLYNEKEYKLARDKLNIFFESANEKRDEGLYLQGQILEAKSDIQNIKAAIESYTTLTKNYPSSKFWEAANKRIIYLKRFYLEAR